MANYIPAMLVGGVIALLAMGGKKKKTVTNGKPTNGKPSNGKPKPATYSDKVYAALDTRKTVAAVAGDKILVILPDHPAGPNGIWQASYDENFLAIKEISSDERVITAVKRMPGTSAETVRFDAIEPGTNEVLGSLEVQLIWELDA